MRWNRCGVRGLLPVVLLLVTALGCNGGEPARSDGGDAAPVDAGPPPGFPEDVEQQYTEMRDCRGSHEHELRYIRVFASEGAREPYAALSPDVPYPVGANLVKLEYDDEACTQLLGYTEMLKLPKGENPAGGDWLWQRLDADRTVIETGAPWRCINCHTFHCAPPYGFDLTCAEEL